jgi:hypothetical protein
MSRISFALNNLWRRRRAFWVIAFLALLILALYWRAASLQGVFFFGDIFRLHYPERVAFLRELSKGHWPLWTPDMLAGYPLLAEGQFAPLYPANWVLHLLLPVDAALNYFVILHYILAGAGMYALARRFDLGRFAALLSAAVYMLSGFMTARLNHLNILAVAAWLPTLLLCTRAALQAPSRAALICLASTLAMTFLAGHPQMALLSVLLALGMALWYVLAERVRPLSGASFWALVGGLALGAGLAAAQLLPSLELALHSQRAGGLDAEFFASFSLHPAYLLLLVSPFLLGDPYPKLSVELIGYVGILPLLLAAAALGFKRKRQVWFFGLLALLSLVLALGHWNPLYALLLRVPLFNWFRVPARFLLWFTLALALLAGWGAQAIAERLADSGRGRLWAWAAAWAALLGALALSDGLKAAEWLRFWRYWPLALALLAGIIGLYAWRGRLRRSLFEGLVLFLVVADLGAFAAVYRLSYNASMPRQEFLASPRVLDFLRADPGLYRVYTHEEITPVLSVMRESLYPNIGLLHGAPSVNGYLPLIPQAWGDFTAQMTADKLNLLGVRYFLIPQVLPVDEASEFYDLEDPFAPTLAGRTVSFAPLTACSLVVESYVSHAADRADGELAATVVLTTSNGATFSFPLRLGLETAEWAYERSDVRAQIKHALPPVARVFPARSGFPAEDHSGYVYRAEFELPAATEIRALRVEPALPRAFVRIERVLLRDADGRQHLLAHLIGESEHALVYRSEDVAVYRNQDALPRAFLAKGGALGLPGEALSTHQLALDGERASAAYGGEARDRAEIVAYKAGRVLIEASLPGDGFLILTDLDYPGWQASVDGQSAPIWLADGVFRAVPLSAGAHTVEFAYRPLSWRIGVGISLLSLVICFIIAVGMRRRAINQETGK